MLRRTAGPPDKFPRQYIHSGDPQTALPSGIPLHQYGDGMPDIDTLPSPTLLMFSTNPIFTESAFYNPFSRIDETEPPGLRTSIPRRGDAEEEGHKTHIPTHHYKSYTR